MKPFQSIHHTTFACYMYKLHNIFRRCYDEYFGISYLQCNKIINDRCTIKPNILFDTIIKRNNNRRQSSL